MSARNKTIESERLDSLVHVGFRIVRKPQFNLPTFVTFRNCSHILISRGLILPNGKSLGHEQPLADLDFEILGAGEREWILELSVGILASEQWEPPKN